MPHTPREIDHEAETVDLPDPGPAITRLSAAGRDRLPGTVGHYRVRRVIGEGGMATVYAAVQENPRRRVALKILKSGIASRSAMRRFEQESQILARLRHPCIAQVYEAGYHDDGSGGVPYFAMEYIPNARPITAFAQLKQLGTRDRATMFAQVCQAVHHGHEQGIIHRDLKPGNILVDATGHPKVIDFGVARATDSDLAVTTLQTDIGQLIGTVQYMSPEQFDADPDLIDRRSDVYALGVVLYELLCDQLPYDVSRARMFDAARVVREEPPTPPSRINRRLKGPIEAIALTALSKDRERRYHSASQLAGDLKRYVSGERISIRPADLRGRLRFLVARVRDGLRSRRGRRRLRLAGEFLLAGLLAFMILWSWEPWSGSRTSAARTQQFKRLCAETANWLGPFTSISASFDSSRPLYETDPHVGKFLRIIQAAAEAEIRLQPSLIAEAPGIPLDELSRHPPPAALTDAAAAETAMALLFVDRLKATLRDWVESEVEPAAHEFEMIRRADAARAARRSAARVLAMLEGPTSGSERLPEILERTLPLLASRFDAIYVVLDPRLEQPDGSYPLVHVDLLAVTPGDPILDRDADAYFEDEIPPRLAPSRRSITLGDGQPYRLDRHDELWRAWHRTRATELLVMIRAVPGGRPDADRRLRLPLETRAWVSPELQLVIGTEGVRCVTAPNRPFSGFARPRL